VVNIDFYPKGISLVISRRFQALRKKIIKRKIEELLVSDFDIIII
jgi:hypothetical protein